jgi:hypothetical protein
MLRATFHREDKILTIPGVRKFWPVHNLEVPFVAEKFCVNVVPITLVFND